MQKFINSLWYRKKIARYLYCLYPLTLIFYIIIHIRKLIYKLIATSIKKPIIIVGNLNLGGGGKTPVVIYLAKMLQQKNYKVGIISRGYKSQHKKKYFIVKKNSHPSLTGDEALLIKQKTLCPVVISKNRVLAAKKLIENYTVDVIISDDGLQHYLLFRNIEIIVVDGKKKFGNSQLLPLGPLREPLSRLHKADFVFSNNQNILNIIKNKYKQNNTYLLLQNLVYCYNKDQHRKKLSEFKNKTVHAVAGIANPENFFQQLQIFGINIIKHAFADHYNYKNDDLDFNDNLDILLTEKDAIKCKLKNNFWIVKYDIKIIDFENFYLKLFNKINKK